MKDRVKDAHTKLEWIIQAKGFFKKLKSRPFFAKKPGSDMSFSSGSQGVHLGDTPTGNALVKPSSAMNVEAGCIVANPCDSNPCPANSICQDKWQTYSCVCQPGRKWTISRGCKFCSLSVSNHCLASRLIFFFQVVPSSGILFHYFSLASLQVLYHCILVY